MEDECFFTKNIRYGNGGNFETTDDPILHIKMSEIHDAIQYFVAHPEKYTLHDRFSEILWCNASVYGWDVL